MPAFPQAILQRAPREARVVLLAGEALLLGGRHDSSVHHQRGRAVVVERGETQNTHCG